jgi:tRNA (adenine22-N1)-methyltransferase
MVTEPYDHIWDCCCDHGLLGASLLARNTAHYIHFVDVVPELMGKLENKLHQFYPRNSQSISQWQTHCINATALPLEKFSGKHLVIIAGVGGDLMTELVNAIYQKNPTLEIDFLLCPVHHQFTLRQQLIQLDFRLKNEILIVENQRYYEILLVSTSGNVPTRIASVGSLIWGNKTNEQFKIAADYLHKTRAHYQRMQLNPNTNVQHIIDAYNAVRLQPVSVGLSKAKQFVGGVRINSSPKPEP